MVPPLTLCAYMKKAPTCVGASFNAQVETRGIEPLTS